MATITTMQQGLLHELSDTYSAEQQLYDAMQEMLGMATSPQVQAGLKQHIAETQQHIQNLDQVFSLFGENRESVTCKGAAGIISEFKTGAKDIKEPALLDGFIAAGGLKGEHYEIATYRVLAAKAQLMGFADAARLLQENLQQEERFAQKLEQVDQQLGQELVRSMPDLVGKAMGQSQSGRMTR